jgi:hypothetical protein
MPGIFGRKQQSFVLLSRYTHPFLLSPVLIGLSAQSLQKPADLRPSGVLTLHISRSHIPSYHVAAYLGSFTSQPGIAELDLVFTFPCKHNPALCIAILLRYKFHMPF